MALKTTTEQLEEVQAAITAILTGGQAYGIAGRSLTRASLPDLYKREKELKVELAREENGGFVVQYGVIGR